MSLKNVGREARGSDLFIKFKVDQSANSDASTSDVKKEEETYNGSSLISSAGGGHMVTSCVASSSFLWV